MPNVSVVIPTHNRPELLKKALVSVLNQTYQDLEIIVVDDGNISAASVVTPFSDPRIRYIKHDSPNRGGAAARNTGIKNSTGGFVAFLDDDDEWLPEKLEIQVKALETAPSDVGFCWTAVRNIFDDKEEDTKIPEGIDDYFELVLKRFKTFLNVTLLIKRPVLDDGGYFDEKFPSHQEADLMIRIAKKYKGLGVNKPLVLVNMRKREHTGGSLERRIAGRKMILDKYYSEFKKRPAVLAAHYFQLALFYRDGGRLKEAREYFKKAWRTKFSFRYMAHYLRSPISKLSALLLGLVLAFIILEVFLRIYDPFGFRIRGNEIILLRNKDFIITNDKTDKLDNSIIHSKNSLGFRGEELSENPDDYLKIIAIGGSTTEEFYISDGKTWPDKLNDELKKVSSRVWLNNAGLDGHSTFGHLILLRNSIVEIKPEVTLFLVGFNDIERSDLSDLDKSITEGDSKIDSFRDLVRTAAKYSRAVSLALNLYRSRVAGEINLRHRITDFENHEYLEMSAAAKKEAIIRQQEYLLDYEIRLEALVDSARENETEPILITQPAVYGFGRDETSGADLARIKISDNLDGETAWRILESYNGITRQVSKNKDVKLIDLARMMPKNSIYYYDTLHFSNAGSEKAGEIISAELLPYFKSNYQSYFK